MVDSFHVSGLNGAFLETFHWADKKVTKEIVGADLSGSFDIGLKQAVDFLVRCIMAAVGVVGIKQQKLVVGSDVPEPKLAVAKVVVGTAVDLLAGFDC